MAFRGCQACLVFLGSNKIDFSLDVPLSAEGTFDSIRRFIIHMSAHIAYQTAATCVGKGLARILAIGSYLQAGQLVRGSVLPRKGACQRLSADDVRAGIAHCYSAGSDAIDIRLAIHKGRVAQDEVGIFGKGTVRHIDFARGGSVQNDCIRSDSHGGDVMPLHVAFQRTAIVITQLG